MCSSCEFLLICKKKTGAQRVLRYHLDKYVRTSSTTLDKNINFSWRNYSLISGKKNSLPKVNNNNTPYFSNFCSLITHFFFYFFSFFSFLFPPLNHNIKKYVILALGSGKFMQRESDIAPKYAFFMNHYKKLIS